MASTGVTATRETARADTADLSGRDRFVGNVIASWVGHSVFIVSGFVMPRLLDRYLGQQLLGVWDLCWSVVGYFGLAQSVIGSSVNRYVARNRAERSPRELSNTVSSALALQGGLACVVFAVSCVVGWFVPRLFTSLGPDVTTARWVLVLLGVSLAVQLATDSFRGVITGCHRWGLHNGLNSGFYAASVIGMIGVLTMGGTLVGVAAVYAGGVAILEVVRVIAAHRVCPELHVSWCAVTTARMRQLVTFGSKSVLDDVSTLVLTQTNSLAIAAALGPAALAVFARPLAICRQIDTIVNKLAFIVAPSASALQRTSRADDLRELFIVTSRLSTMIAAGAIVCVAILGDVFLRLWMGPRYGSGPLLSVLALGSLLPLCQRPSVQILVGMNLHGRIAIASGVCSAIGVVFAWHAAGTYGLIGAALALTVPTTIGKGIIVPIMVCRQLNVPLRVYAARVLLPPFATVLPFSLLLMYSRSLVAAGNIGSGLAAFAAGVVTIALLAWIVVLTPDERRWAVRRLPQPAAAA